MAIKRSNVGLPADRRESSGPQAALDNASSPADKIKLTGSGYDKPFTKPASNIAGAGVVSKWSGNGSW